METMSKKTWDTMLNLEASITRQAGEDYLNYIVDHTGNLSPKKYCSVLFFVRNSLLQGDNKELISNIILANHLQGNFN